MRLFDEVARFFPPRATFMNALARAPPTSLNGQHVWLRLCGRNPRFDGFSPLHSVSTANGD